MSLYVPVMMLVPDEKRRGNGWIWMGGGREVLVCIIRRKERS